MTKSRLLVVDDEPMFGDYVRQVAEELGYCVTVIRDPRRFHEIYDAVDPTMIVLDVVMPDVDGIELINWLIQRGNTAKVLMITGYDPMYTRAAQVFATVMGKFIIKTLNKPLAPTALRSALNRT